MFSCFKSLNKKFICSICSACLLCMTGVSQLRADGDPLTLGSTTVESATVGTNAFLTNTLQDHVYSSRLLSIFSQKPFLYVDAEGRPTLSYKEIPDQNKIPFGSGTSTSVFIAAVPVNDASSDESYESDESSHNNLTWYELDDLSWDKLCVRNPGSAKILYHVVSTDENIKGTMDDSSNLNLKYSFIKMDILADGYFNQNTKMLGFEYISPTIGNNYVRKIAKISMNPNDKGNADFTFGEFLEKLLSMDFFLQTDIYQYDSDGSNLNENLENHPTIYSLCMIMIGFALQTDNDAMLIRVAELMNDNAISYKNQHGNVEQGDGEHEPLLASGPVRSISDAFQVFQYAADEDTAEFIASIKQSKIQPALSVTLTNNGSVLSQFSDSTKEIRLHCPQVASLSSVLVNSYWMPFNIDKENDFIDNITSFVSEFAGSNDFDSNYSNKNLRGYVSANGRKNEEYRVTPNLLNYCLAARILANQNNKQDIVSAIDQLMKQYNISADNPNGTKDES